MNPFVFLDRDGTLIHDVGYGHRADDYQPFPRVAESLLRLQRAGLGLAIVTNQSGIGRGYFDETQFARFHALLIDDLAAAGVHLRATFHCPHEPAAGCRCRKPEIGMLERARDVLEADLAASWVVGDSARDVALAARAGCRGAIRVRTGSDDALPEERPALCLEADDLAAAVELILEAQGAP